MIQKYLKQLKTSGKSPLTIESYSRVLRQFAALCETKGLEVAEADSLTVSEWTDELNVKQNTIRYNLIVLHGFYAWLLRHKKIKENPVFVEEIPPCKQINYNLLDRADINKLLNAAPEEGKNALRDRAMVILLLCSGLRSDELRSLQVADLNFDAGFISVRHGKGDKQRQVPFPQPAQKAVKEYLNRYPSRGLIFSTDGKKMTSQGLNKIVKKYVLDVTGKEVHTHILRHAFASLCDDCGVPLRTIQKALGHSSLSTTENIYVTVLNRTRAAQEISAVFEKVC